MSYKIIGRHFRYQNELRAKDLQLSPLKTPKVISIISDNKDYFSRAIFESPIQIGRIIKAPEGVYINADEIILEYPFVNLTTDKVSVGFERLDLEKLKSLKDRLRKSNDLYFSRQGLVFVPYETFKEGEQSIRDFAESGLARGLEYSQDNLAKKMFSFMSQFELGICLEGFTKFENPISKVICLGILGKPSKDAETKNETLLIDANNDDGLWGNLIAN